jgi:hypothetical protein
VAEPRQLAQPVARRTRERAPSRARGRPNRLAFVLLACFAGLWLTLDARAESKPSVLVYVEGPRADEVREEIAKALPDHVVAADPEPIERAFKKRGITGKLKALGQSKAGKKKIAKAAGIALGAAKAQAAIVALARKAKREVVLLGFEAGADEPAIDETLSPKKKEKEPEWITRLAAALEPVVPAPAKEDPEPTPAAPDVAEKPADAEPAPEPADDTKAAAAEHGYHDALLALALGGELAFRRFDYTDPLFGNIRPYSIDFAPIPYAALELFPLARSGTPFAKDLGVLGSYSRSFGLKSKGEGLVSDTLFERWRAGLAGRIPFALGDRFGLVTLDASYGRWTFDVTPSNPVAAAAPSVAYDLLRAGLGARLPLGEPILLAGFGYQHVLGSGDFEERFPQARAGGIDAKLGAALPIAAMLEGRLWLEYTRFFFDLRPELDDPGVAGGALDEYFGIHLELGLFL